MTRVRYVRHLCKRQELAAALFETFIDFVNVSAEEQIPRQDFEGLATALEAFAIRVVADDGAAKTWQRRLRRVVRP